MKLPSIDVSSSPSRRLSATLVLMLIATALMALVVQVESPVGALAYVLEFTMYLGMVVWLVAAIMFVDLLYLKVSSKRAGEPLYFGIQSGARFGFLWVSALLGIMALLIYWIPILVGA